MKLFWTKQWRYEKSPEEWVTLINDRRTGASHMRLILLAVDKLILEKQVTKEHGDNLKKMIESSDEESNLLAITIMASLKPKKFKKLPKEVEEVKQI